MEVVTASPGGGGMPPYQRRDVEEWSHLDQLTGMLEHARVEKDHWSANTQNSTHQYGKVVDLRDRSAPDGNIHQRQRKQLEVYQSQVPGGSLQVIRTQTVATSSSRWSSRAPASTSSSLFATDQRQTGLHDFENLHLALNPLDLSSQKTKASVGRSGSIGGRRPPSRPRIIVGKSDALEEDIAARLHRVSRLCQQIHNSAEPIKKPPSPRPSIHERQSGDGSVSDQFEIETQVIPEKDFNGRSSSTPSPVKFHQISPSASAFDRNDNYKLTEDKNTVENSWKRSSNIRRSLQLSQEVQSSLTDILKNNSSDSKSRVGHIKQDIDTGRRLSTALRGNNVDLEALDQILKSISPGSSGTYSDSTSPNEESNKSEDLEFIKTKIANKNKRHSFITVESLKEVRGRLRRLSSPIDDYYKQRASQKDEEPDDGIVSEDNSVTKTEKFKMPVSSVGVSRVRSYVYGMEAMLGNNNNKKPVIGTGSLESRTSSKMNGTSLSRSDDWYNRRKSYGFEQVHNQQIDQSNTISMHARNKIESSTDSGICRSTEIVLVPSTVKSQSFNNSNNINKIRDINKSDDINSEQGDNYISHENNNLKVSSKPGNSNNSTIINVGVDHDSKNNLINSYQSNHKIEPSYFKKDDHNELISLWNKRAKSQINANQTDVNRLVNKDSEQITITIPIISEETTAVNSAMRKLYHRQFSENSSVSIETTQDNDNDLKRHSIAVDETKYVNHSKQQPFTQLRRTSLIIGDNIKTNEEKISNVYDGVDDEGNSNLNRKQKKVEFCKTEVHFAAESGRVNIVETDEKPPPTNNFRRRRRNSGIVPNPEDFNKNGLPLIHFGDTSYEKQLFSVPDSDSKTENPSEVFNLEYQTPENIVFNNTVTVSSVPISNEPENIQKDTQENENQPRGILKNKLIKPRPYLLGDNDDIIQKDTNGNNDQDGKIWGIRLRPVQKPEEYTMWKSTVTVQNTSYDIPKEEKPAVTTNTKENTIDIKQMSNYESDSSQSELQKLIGSLQPVRKTSMGSSESAFKQRAPPAVDVRRSSWSVADRVKQVEEMKWTESKGYSTKVNFGGGEATVIENSDAKKHVESQTSWPAKDETYSDSVATKSSFQSNIQKIQTDKNINNVNYNKLLQVRPQVTAASVKNTPVRKSKDVPLLNSSRVDKRSIVPTNRLIDSTKCNFSNDSLSSPLLVGNSVQKPVKGFETDVIKRKDEISSSLESNNKYNSSFNKILVSSYIKNVPNSDKKNIMNSKSTFSNYYLRSVSPASKRNDSTVKKSEYYSAIKSPKPTKKYLEKPREDLVVQKKEEKPDLLQHYVDSTEYVNLSSVIKNESKNVIKNSVNKSKTAEVKKVSPASSEERAESPVYENIDEILNNVPSGTDRESSIIQELTKAADQILQAVNGYTDDDSLKISTDDDEDDRKKNKYRRNSDILETISETKSWKREKVDVNKKKNETTTNLRTRCRSYQATSSTSSIESGSREYHKPIPPIRQNRSEKLKEERAKKKITTNNPEISKVTRARRLQRASSREALLQSHGSSSEDLSNSTEVIRKPRMVRKTKTQQNSSVTSADVSNKKTTVSQTNYARKRECEIRKSAERVPVVGLQEIRHKTAVSTIRSTAEKAATREKGIKTKSEELKKKSVAKSSFTRGNIMSKNQTERSRAVPVREPGSTISAIRTSSGVSVKKAVA